MSSSTQGTSIDNKNLVDWSKELWFALLFVCIGWTVWPLMVYYLGRTIGFDYFLEMNLRVWAESKVYGPLKNGDFRSFTRIAFLSFPWLTFLLLRLTLKLTSRNQ